MRFTVFSRGFRPVCLPKFKDGRLSNGSMPPARPFPFQPTDATEGDGKNKGHRVKPRRSLLGCQSKKIIGNFEFLLYRESGCNV